MQPDDPNNPAMSLGKSLDELKSLKEQLGISVEFVTDTIELLEEVEGYWSQVSLGALTANPTGVTALSSVESFSEQVHGFKLSAENMIESAPYLRSSSMALGTATNVVHHLVSPVSGFDTSAVERRLWQPTEREIYAAKFERWDVNLGRIYRQILQILGRTTSYPERSALPDARTAFDYLLSRLVPSDDEVREQSWWPSYCPHGDDPNKVSTRQKLRYAAETHVKNPYIRDNLINNSATTYEAYRQLSSFHAGAYETFNDQKARAALQQILSVLNLWADGLGL